MGFMVGKSSAKPSLTFFVASIAAVVSRRENL